MEKNVLKKKNGLHSKNNIIKKLEDSNELIKKACFFSQEEKSNEELPENKKLYKKVVAQIQSKLKCNMTFSI